MSVSQALLDLLSEKHTTASTKSAKSTNPMPIRRPYVAKKDVSSEVIPEHRKAARPALKPKSKPSELYNIEVVNDSDDWDLFSISLDDFDYEQAETGKDTVPLSSRPDGFKRKDTNAGKITSNRFVSVESDRKEKALSDDDKEFINKMMRLK